MFSYFFYSFTFDGSAWIQGGEGMGAMPPKSQKKPTKSDHLNHPFLETMLLRMFMKGIHHPPQLRIRDKFSGVGWGATNF